MQSTGVTYEAYIQTLTESSNILRTFNKEFEILKHEILQLNSKDSIILFNILEQYKNLPENGIDTFEKIISDLIRLKIDEKDILNLPRIFLILYFSFFLRSCNISAERNSSQNKKPEEVDDHKMIFFKHINDEIKGSRIQDIFSPLLFFINIFYSSFQKCQDDGTDLKTIFKSFDIFEIIKTKWLQSSYQKFSEYSYRIFNHLVFFALKSFFYVIAFNNSENLDRQKIVPLLLFIFNHQSERDKIDHYFYDIFYNVKALSNRFNNFFVVLMSNAIKSPETATKVWGNLKNETKFQDFMINLQKSINSISVTVSLNINDDSEQIALLHIKLLYKFSKYLDDTHFRELITKCFKYRSTGINSAFDDYTKCFISCVYIMTDFLWKPKFCIYAAKILEKLTRKNPVLMADYYDTLFENRFSDVIKIIDESSNDSRLIVAFLRSADHFIHYRFSYKSTIKLPIFVKYFIFNFFPAAAYRQYQTQKEQWKVFRLLIKTANELILTDYSCLKLAHENKEFITALITLTIYAAKNICFTCLSHEHTLDNKDSLNNEKTIAKKKKSYTDSIDQPLNYKDLVDQLRFEQCSLTLLQNLILIHIKKKEQPTLLYHELFNDQWVSGLIYSLTNFLTLYSKFPEINSSLYQIRSLSFNIFELLCTAAYKIGNDSFEIYYPKKCHKIYNGVVYSSLYTSRNPFSMIRVFEFASSVIETQKTFAYSLLRQTYFSFIAETLNLFEPDKIESTKDWEVFASISKLISKLFINLNSKTEMVQRLIYPEKLKAKVVSGSTIPNTKKANPTLHSLKPSDKCSNDLSPKWCSIIDFIFDQKPENFQNIVNNEFQVLTLARLLKSVICLFLYIDCPLPDMKFIKDFLTNMLKYLFVKEKSENNFKIDLNNDIDLNDFKTYEMYPCKNEFENELDEFIIENNKFHNYRDEFDSKNHYIDLDKFYIDIDRLDWFLNRSDDKLIRDVRTLNHKLFLIDCKTELISSAHSLLNLLLIFPNQESSSDLITQDMKQKKNSSEQDCININNLLNFGTDTLRINILPISTVEEIFKFFETIIMFPKLQNPEFSDTEFKEFLEAARDFLKVSPNSVVFKVVTMLLQLKDEISDELINQNNNPGVLNDLFLIACKYISSEAPDKNATSLVIEISFKLADEPSILENENAIIFLSFFKIAINSKFAIHALKATRILCRQKHSIKNLEKIGFFDFLISSLEPGQNGLTKESPLWPHIFSIFLSLPSQSPITSKFICKCFPYIAFFLNEKLQSENDIYLIRTQESITSLIAHISKNASKFASENPSTMQALVELVYIQLELSFKVLQFAAEKEIINFDNLLNIELHNAPTSSILIIHSCLLTLNNLVSHPFMVLPKGFQKEDSDQNMINLLVTAVEDFCKILEKIHENDVKDDKRLQFSNIIYRSIEMDAQLFYGLCTSSLASVHLNKDEKQKIKDRCKKFTESVKFNLLKDEKDKDAKNEDEKDKDEKDKDEKDEDNREKRHSNFFLENITNKINILSNNND